MKKGLWRLSVSTRIEGEDAVTALVERLFSQAATSYTRSGSPRTVVSLFLPFQPARNREEFLRLQAGLHTLKTSGLDVGSCRIKVTKIRQEDWANSWKRHFKSLEIRSALLISPVWSRRRPRHGQVKVVLDPGLAFGTGMHPTTEFCLRHLVRSRKKQQRQSVLDLGTGSGILAIAAAKLRYGPVEAIDNDPVAIKVARANARKNQVGNRIRFRIQNLRELSPAASKAYDVICANLISTLLISEAVRMVRLLKPGGTLIVSGILSREFADVRRHYETVGLVLLSSAAKKEWRSGSFGLPDFGQTTV